MSRHCPTTLIAFFQGCATTPPSISKLHSLLFYAEGWAQAVLSRALIEGDFIALITGPKHPMLQKLPRNGAYLLPVKADTTLSPEERDLLGHVWKRYGHMDDIELKATLLAAGTPWSNAYFGRYRETAIPRTDIGRWCTRLALAGRKERQTT